MIVTEGGKNIYPEDIETAFDGIAVKEYCVFAANYIWPAKNLGHEMLILVLRLEPGQEGQVSEFSEQLKQDISLAIAACLISNALADAWSGRKIFRAPPP